jgi:hypothetical protein
MDVGEGAFMMVLLVMKELFKHCFGKTPWQTFLDSKALAHGKQMDRTMPTTTVAA